VERRGIMPDNVGADYGMIEFKEHLTKVIKEKLKKT
jgi:hypothetical protein